MLRFALAVVLGFGVITLAAAQDKKDEKKTLEGTLVCSKCNLKETKVCGNALLVKEGEKKITYFLVDKGVKEPYHKECCTADAPGTKVTGKVVEKDKKLTIEEPKVELKK